MPTERSMPVSSDIRRARLGMSLIEIMVALSLAAALLVALTGVLRGMESQLRLIEFEDQQDTSDEVLQWLRRDLATAESVWVTEDSLKMLAEPRPVAQGLTGRRTIEYRFGTKPLPQSGLGRMLVRLDGDISMPLSLRWTEFMVERIDNFGTSQPLPPRPGPPPTRVRIRWKTIADPEGLVHEFYL